MRQALELCKEYAKEKRNYSIERIAIDMGIADHWSLYKWISTGRMPVVLIPAYETACGIDFVTRWLAASRGKLVIDMPKGRTVSTQALSELQLILNETMNMLIRFYGGSCEAEETLSALQNALDPLAWHRGNVQQYQQPEFDLEEVEQ
ncbi:hypothetical protein [Yersinia pseudotuberculosis]|uniref:hypothetical protein n=1 Tax=Yersinia pseudotuberculosis TaxID=633 RepID=UPI0018D4F792|nr:hypothetical protein [Yersinia pseudotuberculosis]